MQKITVVKLGMSALLSVVLAACSSTGTETTEEDVDTSAIQNTEATTQPAETTPQLSAAELAEQEREREALAMTVFYFDFDQSELKPEAREALVYHANQLRANPSMMVRLEGHADERGTREYNLALGERRAQAVQRYLEVQGVNGNQLEVISYGEERPAQNGTSEAAYAQNRRVEMVYN